MGVQMPISHNRPDTKAGSQIGLSVQRLESRDKVTGRAEYTHLMQLPGMLHAKLFRSTVAHGRVGSLNVSLAKQAAARSAHGGGGGSTHYCGIRRATRDI
jgi:xanthine dehydrogenase molybdopterin-binding subunit B